MNASDLVEIEAIKQLKARYFRLLDTKRWDAWREVFTEDLRAEIHGPHRSVVFSGANKGCSASLGGAVPRGWAPSRLGRASGVRVR